VRDPSNSAYVVETLQPSLWDAKPPIIELDGTINVVLRDWAIALATTKCKASKC